MNQDKQIKHKSGVFKRDRVAELLEAAKAVPDKAETKETLTVGELIPKLWPAIGKFMNKRYNYRDIAKWMISQGVNASEDTLISAIGDQARKHDKGREKNVNGDKIDKPVKEKIKSTTDRQPKKKNEQVTSTGNMNSNNSKSDTHSKKDNQNNKIDTENTSPAFIEEV